MDKLNSFLYFFVPIVVIILILKFYLTAKFSSEKQERGIKIWRNKKNFRSLNDIKEDTNLKIVTLDDDIGGVVVGRYNTLQTRLKKEEKYIVDISSNHVEINGSTGTGKSQRLIIPTLFSIANACENMIVNDFKGELIGYAGEHLKQKEYEIITLNFRNSNNSYSWNPLHEIYEEFDINNISEAENLIRGLGEMLFSTSSTATDSYHNKQLSNMFLNVTLFLLYKAKKDNDTSELNFSSITNLIINEWENVGERMRISPDPFIEKLYKNIQSTFRLDDETASITSAVASNKLTIFNDDILKKIMGGNNDLNSKIFLEDKKACFIILPNDSASYNFLVTMFIDFMNKRLIKRASKKLEQEQKEKNPHATERLKNRVNFVFDEFGAFPRVPEMATKIAVNRSYNLKFILAFQGHQMLENKYEKEAKIILNNCSIKVFVGGDEDQSTAYWSKRIGQKTIKKTTKNGGIKSYSYEERTIANEKEIAEKPYNFILFTNFERRVFCSNNPNFYETFLSKNLQKYFHEIQKNDENNNTKVTSFELEDRKKEIQSLREKVFIREENK